MALPLIHLQGERKRLSPKMARTQFLSRNPRGRLGKDAKLNYGKFDQNYIYIRPKRSDTWRGNGTREGENEVNLCKIPVQLAQAAGHAVSARVPLSLARESVIVG